MMVPTMVGSWVDQMAVQTAALLVVMRVDQMAVQMADLSEDLMVDLRVD